MCQGSETILLVEDEQSVRTMVRRMLESNGYRVLDAENGLEAMQLMKEIREPIHLLVTDVVMPEIGGSKLADSMRVTLPDLRVLYISGYHTDSKVELFSLKASESLLKKPFTTRQLVSAVRQQIDSMP